MGWVADRDYNASLNILRKSGLERPVAPVEPSTPWARRGSEAGSPVLEGRVVHTAITVNFIQLTVILSSTWNTNTMYKALPCELPRLKGGAVKQGSHRPSGFLPLD